MIDNYSSFIVPIIWGFTAYSFAATSVNRKFVRQNYSLDTLKGKNVLVSFNKLNNLALIDDVVVRPI